MDQSRILQICLFDALSCINVSKADISVETLASIVIVYKQNLKIYHDPLIITITVMPLYKMPKWC